MPEHTVFPVAGGLPQAVEDSAFLNAALTPHGFLIVQDWRQAYINAGSVYQVQWGTEDAPIATTATIDDLLVSGVVDVPADTVILPIYWECHIADWTTATDVNVLLEVDNAQARYSSGGTAYTPTNLNTINGNSLPSGIVAYVGPDVTVGAKSAVPASQEIHRKVFSEDAIATPTPGDSLGDVWQPEIVPVIGDAASLVIHVGAGTADANFYATLWFIAMTKAQFIRS